MTTTPTKTSARIRARVRLVIDGRRIKVEMRPDGIHFRERYSRKPVMLTFPDAYAHANRQKLLPI